MNPLVAEFIHNLKALPPCERLLAVHDFKQAWSVLEISALSEAKQNEEKAKEPTT